MPGKLRKIFRDVANDPATSIALGSTFMAASYGGTEGAFLNLATTIGIAGLRAYESVTGREQGRPFGALAVVNFSTALSIIGHGLKDHGIDPKIIPQAVMGLGYVFSSVRSTLLSLQQRRGTYPTHTSDDPQFYQGISALMMSRPDRFREIFTMDRAALLPMIFALAGIGRTLIKDEEGKPQSFLRRHFTAARSYAVQYGLSALVTASDWEQGVAYALWSWGFTRFNKNENAELKKGVKNLLSLPAKTI